MKTRLLAGICLATFAVLLSPGSAAARTKASPSPAGTSTSEADANASPAASNGKMRAIPFRGTIASIDEAAKTFTIAGKQNSRSLKITDTTVITKAGQPATMKDVVANEEVRGSYYKMSDSSMEAKTVKLGPLTEAEKAIKDARKEKRDARKAAASATP